MVKHADMEMTVMKEKVFTHSSLETGGMAHHTRRPHGEALRGSVRGGGNAGKHVQEPLLWFP